MFTLLGIIIFGVVIGIIALVLGAFALPIIIIVMVIGIVFSIIAILFKVIFGLPALLIIIGIGAILYNKNKRIR
jgi:hypothetical protein